MSFTRGRILILALAGAVLLAAGVAGAEEVSPNAQRAWDSYNSANGVVFPPLSTFPANIIRINNNTTAEVYADSMLTSLAVQRVFRDTIPSVSDYSQTAHRQNGNGSSAPICTGSICAPGSKWVMWDTPFLEYDTRKRNDGYLGYDLYSSGFATGITRLLGENSTIGLAVGYDSRKQVARDDYWQKIKADTFHSALYGGTSIGCFFVDGYAGYSWSSKRSDRRFDDGAVTSAYGANFNDSIWSTGLKASYIWILPSDFRITPAIGVDYSYVHQNSFTEKVGDVGNWNRLAVDSADYHAVQTPITVAINKTFSADFLTFGGACSLWTPEVRGGWVPQFGSKRASVNATNYDYTPGSAPSYRFTSDSTDIGRSYGTVGAGLKIQIRDKFIFALDYDYRFGDKYSSHVITGTYGVSF